MGKGIAAPPAAARVRVAMSDCDSEGKGICKQLLENLPFLQLFLSHYSTASYGRVIPSISTTHLRLSQQLLENLPFF